MAMIESSVDVVQLVAGQLLLDEAVVRLVLVEGVDDVIAVAPGERLFAVALVAVGLGVADHVQPEARPALAVLRPGQQAVEQGFVSTRRCVGHERLDLLRRRRQTDQVEIRPADQRPLVGRRVRLQPLFFQLRQHERVDRVGHPIPVLHVRHRGPTDRLKRPPRLVGGGDAARVQVGGAGVTTARGPAPPALRPGRHPSAPTASGPPPAGPRASSSAASAGRHPGTRSP